MAHNTIHKATKNGIACSTERRVYERMVYAWEKVTCKKCLEKKSQHKTEHSAPL